jgi:glycosyltransferase involved in cell wall biosynthesis
MTLGYAKVGLGAVVADDGTRPAARAGGGRGPAPGPTILHIAEVVRGGTATYLNALAAAQFAAFGPGRVHFLLPEIYRPDVAPIPDRTLRTVPGPVRTLGAPWRYIGALRRAIRELRPDLIHAHGSFAGLYLRLYLLATSLSRRPRPRVVYCAHGWAFQREGSRHKRRLYALIERLLAGLSDASVSISRSEYEAALAVGLPRGRQHVVYNGLADLPQEPGPDAAPPDAGKPLALLFVGRLDRQKGIDILVSALRLLPPERYRLYVAGAAVVPGEDITTRVGDHVPAGITFLGWQSPAELERLYAEIDAVIVPSRWEGFGYVAVEAMRAGKAVIASTAGALPEIVRDGQTGWLFDSGRPDELARILMREDAASLADLGRNGRKRFLTDFTADRMNQALIALYHDLLAPSGQAAPLSSPAAG